MALRAVGYPPAKITAYLFVDGAYLREVIEAASHEFFAGKELSVDYKALATNFRRCFYYDCVAPIRKGESEGDYRKRVDAQKEKFQQLGMTDGWHVFLGVLTGTGPMARRKQVDIQISVDMLSHSHLRNMDEITFIAGDQDFKPLVDALVKQGMYVRLWYEPRSASKELIFAADARLPLGIYDIHRLLTPACQKSLILPARYYQGGKDIQNATLVARAVGTSQDIQRWRLADGQFRITHVEDSGHCHHLTHPDEELVRSCC